MSNKKPHIVKVKAKGLADTGIAESTSREIVSAGKGRHYVAIVEVVCDETHDLLGDQQIAFLSITQFWFAEDGTLKDHLRDITKVLHQNKGVTGGDQPLPLGEKSIAAVVEQGALHRPHPFLPVDAADDNGICDVCGALEGAPAHKDRAALADPFATSTVGDDGGDSELGTVDEPVVLDVDDISAEDLEALAHVHDITGRCAKNDYGDLCDTVEATSADPDQEADAELANPDDPTFEDHPFVEPYDVAADDPAMDTCVDCQQPRVAAVHEVHATTAA